MKLILAKEAARRLNVSPQRLYEMVRTKHIPPGVVVRLGERQIRFNEEQLNEWIENGGFIKEVESNSGGLFDVSGK